MTDNDLRLPRRSLVFACLLFTCAGLVFLRTIVLVDRSPDRTFFYNLSPLFDGAQYFASAASFVNEFTWKIWVNGDLHPSLYPFGYSLVIAALIPLVQEPVHAAYLANMIASGLILAVGGLVTWWLHGTLAASVVVLVIATMPAFVILGNSPLSESSAGLVMISCVGSWLLYAHTKRPVWGILAAFLVGVGVWYKTGFVFFVPLFVFATMAPTGVRVSNRVHALAVHGVAASLGVAPVLAYNWLSFGSPVRTGYHYWSTDTAAGWPADLASGPRFAVSNAWPRLVDLGREAFELPMQFSTANIFASGSWMSASLMVLLAVASTFVLRQRAWIAILAGSSGYLVSMLCYYRYFGRLYFPLLLIGTLAVGPLVAAVVDLQPRVLRRVMAVALGGALVASVFGFSRPGSPLQLLTLLRTDRFERDAAANFLLAREVQAQVGGKECLVVTDLLTPFVSAIVGPSARVISFAGERQFSFRRQYEFSIETRDAEIARAVQSHGCIIMAMAGHFSEGQQRLPAGANLRWEPFYQFVHRGNREYGAARLTPAPAPR